MDVLLDEFLHKGVDTVLLSVVLLHEEPLESIESYHEVVLHCRELRVLEMV